MPILCEKKLCSGCHSCYSVCPTNSIKMEADVEGFLYPVVNETKCVECKLCEKSCPILNSNVKSQKTPKAFAAFSKDENVINNSSSGGVFYHIAKMIIDDGGVVFGAAFDDNFNVEHKAIDSLADIRLLQGSKYVQSKIGDTYKQAKQFLKNGRKVLFSGTPCQIEGLRAFLGQEYDNLYVLDFICHGVPSPKVWQMYVKHREKIASSKTKSVEFRNKKYGWESFSLKFGYSNDTEYTRNLFDDPYMKGFLSDLYLRTSCYNCRAKGLDRLSDITLADFWGAEAIVPEMYNKFGTSLVLINNKKGEYVFEKINSNLWFRNCDSMQAITHNSAAIQSVSKHKKYDEFFATVSEDNFEETIHMCLKKSIAKKIKIKFKNMLIKIKKVIKKR